MRTFIEFDFPVDQDGDRTAFLTTDPGGWIVEGDGLESFCRMSDLACIHVIGCYRCHRTIGRARTICDALCHYCIEHFAQIHPGGAAHDVVVYPLPKVGHGRGYEHIGTPLTIRTIDEVQANILGVAQKSKDASELVKAAKEGLREVGIRYRKFGVQFVDPAADAMWFVDIEQGYPTWRRTPPGDPGVKVVFDIWKSGRTSYRHDLAAVDPFGEGEWFLGRGVRSIAEVPFSMGTVAVNDANPHAFEDWQVRQLERVTKTLEEALRHVGGMPMMVG